MAYSVYILYSSFLDLFYKGHTNDLDKRLDYHNSGYENYTKKGRPWKLCWSVEKENKSSAYQLETKLKKLSGRRLIIFMSKYKDDLTKEGVEIVC